LGASKKKKGDNRPVKCLGQPVEGKNRLNVERKGQVLDRKLGHTGEGGRKRERRVESACILGSIPP